MIRDANEILLLFGENLRRLRKERKLSQPQLASLCDVDQKEISLIERGLYNPGVLVIVDLSRALEISPSELLATLK